MVSSPNTAKMRSVHLSLHASIFLPRLVIIDRHQKQPGRSDNGHGECRHMLLPGREKIALFHRPLVKEVDAHPRQGHCRQRPHQSPRVVEGVGYHGRTEVVGPGRIAKDRGKKYPGQQNQYPDEVSQKSQQPELPPELFQHRSLAPVLQCRQRHDQHHTVHRQVGGGHQNKQLWKKPEKPDGQDHVIEPHLFFHGFSSSSRASAIPDAITAPIPTPIKAGITNTPKYQ